MALGPIKIKVMSGSLNGKNPTIIVHDAVGEEAEEVGGEASVVEAVVVMAETGMIVETIATAVDLKRTSSAAQPAPANSTKVDPVATEVLVLLVQVMAVPEDTIRPRSLLKYVLVYLLACHSLLMWMA